jgi:hypothetical protein
VHTRHAVGWDVLRVGPLHCAMEHTDTGRTEVTVASMAPISTCIQARIRPGSLDLAVPVPASPLFRFRPGGVE